MLTQHPPPQSSPTRGERAREPVAFGRAHESAKDAQVLPAQSVPIPEANFHVPPGPAATPSIPAPAQELPIDLPTALQLADSTNPVIAAARSQIAVAQSNLLAARVLMLPSLNAGANYHAHAGNFQRSAGNILRLSDQSFYFGGGARAIAQGTVEIPAVNISASVADALYEPLAARQRVDVSRFDASATANSVLLEVATLYQDLHRAGALLTARRQSESEAGEVVKITAGFARTGQGRQADADRARSQQQLVRASIRRAEEEVAKTSAALCRRLHLDPSTRLFPAGDPLAILSLIDPSADPETLIATAIGQRPEVGGRSAAIAVAETRLRAEKVRPFLPTLWLGFSGGAFGGGSNLTPPNLGNFGGRTDFDVVAYWTLENFGFGNLALQRRRSAEVGAATEERARVIARVREEVASARADALARREQIVLAVEELAASGEGFHQDLERARQVRGLPIEVLNNLDLLIKSREDLIETVTGFNRAQLRLFVALGVAPPLEIRSSGVPTAGETASADRERASSTAPLLLTNARQEAVRAAGEYDRRQAELVNALAADKPLPSREKLVNELKALAEAHRNVIATQLSYDRVLHSVQDTSGAAAPPVAR